MASGLSDYAPFGNNPADNVIMTGVGPEGQGKIVATSGCGCAYACASATPNLPLTYPRLDFPMRTIPDNNTRAISVALAAVLAVTALSRVAAQTPPWAKVSPAQVEAAQKLGVPVAFENSLGMRFVLIPAGKFLMGSRDTATEVASRCAMPNANAGWFADEHPRHEVTLGSAFYLAIHEVTQAAYEALTTPKNASNKQTVKQISDNYPDGFTGENHPVVKVPWNEADRFCKALSAQADEKGREYAMPTEAQWEYACRAGTTTPFSFGETLTTDQANYNGGYTYADGRKGEYRAKPVPVGSFAPNAWGLYDMHGNVSELCADRYGPYGSAAASDPQGGSANSGPHIVRGGSWRSYPGACRSACRLGEGDGFNIGFRVRCAVPTKAP